MEKNVEITEIKILLGKKEITLSVADARKLKKALEDMFGEKVVREVIREDHHHHHDYYPYRWYWDYQDTTYLCGGAIGTGFATAGAVGSGATSLEYKNGTMLCSLSGTGDMLEKN